MLPNVFKTWFVFKNKLSIIKRLFLDLAWTGLSSMFRTGPAIQLKKAEKMDLILEQTWGFSDSKHPITFVRGTRYLKKIVCMYLQFYIKTDWLSCL